MLQVSLALVLASVVVGFTLIKNANYALAESRATSAAKSLDDGQLKMAMHSIDRAIAVASDVGRYHVVRANILNQVRSSTTAASGRVRLAQEAYRANGRAITANPFDIYGRLHFAESVLTLAGLGQAGKGEEAIRAYQQLTMIQPRYWLSHFLLGRAYMDMSDPERAIEAYSEAIRLDPLEASLYERRASAYVMLGEHNPALNDYGKAIKLSPLNQSIYVRRAIALFALGQLDEAIKDFDEAIRLYDSAIEELVRYQKIPETANLKLEFAVAYNNRGSAYYQLDRISRSIQDYDRAIQLSPRSPEFYINRATAYELLNRNAEAQQDLERAIQLGFEPASLRQD